MARKDTRDPDEGSLPVETQALLEQVGELVIDGRLYVYEPPVVDAVAPDKEKESDDVA